MNKKLFITGGCGFIGTNIALMARDEGHEVTVMDSFVRNGVTDNAKLLKDRGVTVLHEDIRDSEFEGVECNAIIHLGANPGIPWSIADPVYDFNVNALGTLRVLEFARKTQEKLGKPVPFIYASTNKVYSDMINDLPITKMHTRYKWETTQGSQVTVNGITELFPIDGFGRYPHSPYGVSKLTGDMYCQEYFHTYKVPTVVNRMSCIYGYYQKGVEDQGWIDHFVRTIAFGDGKINVYGDGKQVRDMLWGKDLARLYLMEIENIRKVKGMVFNVGGGMHNSMSLVEAIDEIHHISGKKAHITHHPWRHADQKIYISDISKVRYETGWEPTVRPRVGIKKMYEWYKANL